MDSEAVQSSCSSAGDHLKRATTDHPALNAGIAQVVEEYLLQQQVVRQDTQRAVPKTELELRHTEQCRLLPNRLMMLDRMPPNAVVAEVGVAFGDFSQEIIERTVPSQLHLIDAWSTTRYRDGLQTIRGALAEDIQKNRVVIKQGISTDVLSTYPDDYFDWIYIDTNHTYATTIEELRIARRVVRPTGRIAGHDHCTGNVVKPFPYGVVQAVTQFCKEENWGYEYLTAESHGHASFCLLKL